MSLIPVKVIKNYYTTDWLPIIERAYEVLDWWSYLIDIEYPRFLEALKNEREKGKSSSYIPEKMLFLTVIQHTISSIDYLVTYLQSIGNHSLDKIYSELRDNQTLKDFRLLRNMNEHKEAYRDGKGRRQDQFVVQPLRIPGIKESFNIDGHSTVIGPQAQIQLGKLKVEDIMSFFQTNISFFKEWFEALLEKAPEKETVETWDEDENTGQIENYRIETNFYNL